jgi:hypothetical protein
MNGLEKSGSASTGEDVRADLRAVNAASAASDHVNASLRSAVRGAAMVPYFATNLR